MDTAYLQDLRPGRALSGVVPGGVAVALLAALGPRPALPLLVVVPTREEAARLAAELGALAPALAPGVAVHHLAADDCRTWDGLSPHPEIPRQRLAALAALDDGEPALVVAPARALVQRVLAPAALAGWILRLSPGDRPGVDGLVQAAVARGYLVAPAASEPGTVSRRGDVVDLWPTDRPSGPVRFEFFDDEIESMIGLDARTRRGTGPVRSLRVLPAREAMVDAEALRRAGAATAAAVDAMGAGHALRRRALHELGQGLWFPGAEDYLCALHPVAGALGRCPRRVVVEPAAVREELGRFESLAWERWHARPPEERPPVLPEQRFERAEEVWAELASAPALGAMVPDADDLATRENTDLRVVRGELAPVAARVGAWLGEGWQVALCVDSQARAERALGLLHPHGLRPVAAPLGQWPLPGQLAVWVGPLTRGFHCGPSRRALIAADELFGPRERGAPAPRRTVKEAALSTLSKLKAGDLVVHVVHGVGRFIGLRRLQVPGGPDGGPLDVDVVELHYAGDNRMYLPVTRLDLITPWRGPADAVPPLDKLGGATWARRKERVRVKVAGLAHELLSLHALRTTADRPPLTGTPADYALFEEGFAFVETPDQAAAIRDVLEDLARPRPMDRLVVGDVGFGKTEVAMRAAMRVVLGGRQVAVLCPTTVLAHQHFRTFTERFAPFAVKVEMWSSFQDASAVRAVQERLRSGAADLVIGTHALLGRAARFRDLGLLIVDEEHRFGVKQKDRLQQQAVAWAGHPVDLLAMSATPIPRTLHMALSGLRAVSLIQTPPEGRRPVVTRVARWNDTRIRDEILHELRRGGQVFFVHNRVQSIGQVLRRLSELVPEARFGVAHGQMEDHALERVLVDFVERRFHVLVCTTIIETGVDMPSVNTILVNRADQLGLAELHQLRGRVGRSSVRGYCTLLLPEDDAEITREAVERLRVLQDNTDLGAGMAIASADLEQRGAGDLLGESQHGNIAAVGLDAYVELLEEAIAAARGTIVRARLDPEIEVPVPALIPEDWIDDVGERLAAYRALAACRGAAEVRDLLGAWEDRWGAPPEPVLHLGWVAEAKVRARALGLGRVSVGRGRIRAELHETSTLPEAGLRALATRERDRFTLPGAPASGRPPAVEARVMPDEAGHPFRVLHWVLQRLEGLLEPDGAPAPLRPPAPAPPPPPPAPGPRAPTRRLVRPPGSGRR